MIGVGIVLVIVGLVLLFFAPWVGAPLAVSGLALAVLWLAGFGRRMRSEQSAGRRYLP